MRWAARPSWTNSAYDLSDFKRRKRFFRAALRHRADDAAPPPAGCGFAAGPRLHRGALHPDELLLLAVGAALGGLLGDLAGARFFTMVTRESAMLLQNALLFTLIALPSLYFGPLNHTIAPMNLSRLFSFPVALLVGLLGSFLSFGAEPLTLTLYFFLFEADGDEGAFAALTVSLFAMVGKLIVLLIRQRLILPDANVLLWLLPGAIIGTLLALWPAIQRRRNNLSMILLRLSLFTSLLNIAAAALH